MIHSRPFPRELVAILCIALGLHGGSILGQSSVVSLGEPSIELQLLDGGWDLDGDGNAEWLALSAAGDSGSTAIYYEAALDGPPVEAWRYSPAAGIVISGGTIARLVNRTQPSLILTLNGIQSEENANWLFAFRNQVGTLTFSDQPTSRWNHPSADGGPIAANQLLVADMDDNGDEELIISTSNNPSELIIADWTSTGFSATHKFVPGPLGGGTSTFETILADLNGDLRQDVVTVGRGASPEMKVFINGRHGFIELTLDDLGGIPILADASASGDLNGDGQDEVVIVHTGGEMTIVSMAGRTLSAAPMGSQIEGLVDLAIYDADGDSTAEMVYLMADGTLASNDPNLMLPAIEPDSSRSGVGSLMAIGATGQSPGTLLYSMSGALSAEALVSATGEPVAQTIVMDVEPSTDVDTPPSEPAEPPLAQVDPTFDEVMVSREGSEVYFPNKSTAPDPRALPVNRSPDYVIHPGEEFARDVIGKRMDQFASFRFLSKAPDMVINLQRQSIIWVPTQEQLGAWNIAYEITYQLGVKPELMIGDSVIAQEKEIVTGELLIYVNDKPSITTEPTTTDLLAGHLFAYRLGVNDHNSDARIDFRLETGPPGMTIDPGGILTWRTDASHHDDYQVVIAISDGFDRDVQTFKLMVNAQLTITSSAEKTAKVGKPYSYRLEVFQPGSTKEHTFTMLEAPEGMAMTEIGLISWIPEETQVDTQRFRVRVSDGVAEEVQTVEIYVNSPPRMTSLPPRVISFLSGDTLRLTVAGEDDNADADLEWRLIQGPVDMTIDSVGNIEWASSYQDLDGTGYTVELSDGMDVTRFKGVVFANSPVGISSTPPDSAIIGVVYDYSVQVRDENEGTVLKYRRPVIIRDISRSSAFEVEIQDDQYAKDLPRYVSDFRKARNILINKPPRPGEGETVQSARIDLKQAVRQLFIEGDKLVVIIQNPDQGMVTLEDVLWELFQGGRGVMPRYSADPVPLVHYTLSVFPDGMTISYDGNIEWTPTPSQAGLHDIRLTVSDGFTRAEQIFQVYANYPPVIISQPDTIVNIEKRYTYQVQVDDKNADANIVYRLTKAPEGMQIDTKGKITWSPTVEQLNWHEYIVEVTDGHGMDRQAVSVFANMVPRVISQPKPVALNSYEYNYRIVAEDLNRDEFRFRAVKLPRFSEFDEESGRFTWRPKGVQKGPNDVSFEVIDSRGGITTHEFQVHVFEDPSRRQFLFTSWPIMLAFSGLIFVLGLTLGV